MCKQVEIITMKYARKCIKIFWQNISKFNDFGCHSYLLLTSAMNQIKNCYIVSSNNINIYLQIDKQR